MFQLSIKVQNITQRASSLKMTPIILVLLLAIAIHGQRERCLLGAFPVILVESGCCGVDSATTNYIVGGVETVPGQYPWLAALEYLDEGDNIPTIHCGGSLISGRYVLTAAHCVSPRKPRAVRLGEYDISHEGPDCREDIKMDCTDGATTVNIQNIRVHEQYKRAPYHGTKGPMNDIALIRLVKTVQFSNFIRPICLPTVDVNDLRIDEDLYTAGWGLTTYDNFTPNRNITRHVNMPLLNYTECATAFGIDVNDRIVCVGGLLGKDSCNGDSGGPLMRMQDGRYDLIGVLSFGHKECGKGRPAGYTNVFKYRQWIMENIL